VSEPPEPPEPLVSSDDAFGVSFKSSIRIWMPHSYIEG